MGEAKSFLLFPFNVIELELYLLHNCLILCIRPVWVLSAISFESCRHCLAILFSGKPKILLWRLTFNG